MTTITPYRSMRGISSAMGKPVNGHNLSLTLQGLVRNSGIGNIGSVGAGSAGSHLNSSSPGYPQPLTVSPVAEFTCTCAPGWTGPTCEISKYQLPFFSYFCSLSHLYPHLLLFTFYTKSLQHPRPDCIEPLIP